MTFQRRVGLSAVAKYLLPHEQEIFTARSHPASLLQPFVLALGGILAATAVTMAHHDSRLARLLAWVLVIFLLCLLVPDGNLERTGRCANKHQAHADIRLLQCSCYQF